MSGQGKITMRRRETGEQTVIKRIRKRVHTTISPDTYEYLKNTAVNVGQLLDNVVSEIRKVTPHNLVLISQKKEELWAWPDLNGRSSPCKGDVMTG